MTASPWWTMNLDLLQARTPVPPPTSSLRSSHLDLPALAPGGTVGHALVVEDDPEARTYIRLVLQKSGFKVTAVGSGEEAMDHFHREPLQVALLDVGLPGMNGFEVCKQMRACREDLAILMLTGRGEDSDKVSGLNLGADDYLVKPFEPTVLMARIHAVLRRCTRQSEDLLVLTQGDLRAELLGMKVYKGGREVDLTPREFILLTAFLRNPGRVLTRDWLRDAVWGKDHHGSAKAVDVLVCKLREKLEDDPAHPTRFRTEWGLGFIAG